MNIFKTIAIFYGLTIGLCGISSAQTVSLSIPAFSAPQESAGAVHIRTGEKKSQPLLLSKNRFTAPLPITMTKVELYEQPFDPDSKTQTPFVSIELPAGSKSYKILVWATLTSEDEVKWLGHAFATDNWPKTGMILANFTDKTIIFESGNTRKSIERRKTIVFKGQKQKNGSPVKLFILNPKDPEPAKLVFSSVWSVPDSEQEILLIYTESNNGRLKTHSYITKPSPPKEHN